MRCSYDRLREPSARDPLAPHTGKSTTISEGDPVSTTMQRARRALLAGALTLVGVPLVAASTADAAECAASEAPCVTLKIVGTDADTPTFTAVPLANKEPLENPDYSVRSKPNEQPTPLAVAKAWSLATVIEGHQDEVKFSETDNPGKFPAVLDKPRDRWRRIRRRPRTGDLHDRRQPHRLRAASARRQRRERRRGVHPARWHTTDPDPPHERRPPGRRRSRRNPARSRRRPP